MKVGLIHACAKMCTDYLNASYVCIASSPGHGGGGGGGGIPHPLNGLARAIDTCARANRVGPALPSPRFFFNAHHKPYTHACYVVL